MLIDRLKRFRDSPFVVVIEVVSILAAPLTGMYAAFQWATERFPNVAGETWFAGLVGVLLIVIVSIGATKLERSDTRKFSITLALQFRVGALLLFAAYSFHRNSLWPVVAAYGLYLVLLVCAASWEVYHSQIGRLVRNTIDMLFGVAATSLDSHLVGPPVLLFLIPLAVGAKYGWIRHSVLTLALPLIGFGLIGVTRIVEFYYSPAYANTFRGAFEASASPAWSFVIVLAFLVILPVTLYAERYRTWRPYVLKIATLVHAHGKHAQPDAVAATVRTALKCRSCSVVRKGPAGATLIAGDTLSAKEIDGYLSMSPRYSARAAVGHSADSPVMIIAVGKLSSDDNSFFSHEDSYYLEMAADLIVP